MLIPKIVDSFHVFLLFVFYFNLQRLTTRLKPAHISGTLRRVPNVGSSVISCALLRRSNSTRIVKVRLLCGQHGIAKSQVHSSVKQQKNLALLLGLTFQKNNLSLITVGVVVQFICNQCNITIYIVRRFVGNFFRAGALSLPSDLSCKGTMTEVYAAS